MITQTWPPFTFYPRLINDLKNNWPANSGNHFCTETRFKWRLTIGRFASPKPGRVKLALLQRHADSKFPWQCVKMCSHSKSRNGVSFSSDSFTQTRNGFAGVLRTSCLIGRSSFNHRWAGVVLTSA